LQYFKACKLLVLVLDVYLIPVKLLPMLRMCRALMPGDEESMSDEAIWETLPVSKDLPFIFRNHS